MFRDSGILGDQVAALEKVKDIEDKKNIPMTRFIQYWPKTKGALPERMNFQVGNCLFPFTFHLGPIPHPLEGI